MCITSTFAGAAHLCPFGLQPPLEYSKDTQQLTASNRIQPGRPAAQPCSYIYPIYSVVKNRRAVRIAAASLIAPSGGPGIHAQGSGFTVWRRLNLVQVCEIEIFESGGAERDRTVDPLLAKQVLSQLSYSPISHQYNR